MPNEQHKNKESKNEVSYFSVHDHDFFTHFIMDKNGEPIDNLEIIKVRPIGKKKVQVIIVADLDWNSQVG